MYLFQSWIQCSHSPEYKNIMLQKLARKVREAYLGMIFVDCLSFLKKDDEWKIYTKLFHVES